MSLLYVLTRPSSSTSTSFVNLSRSFLSTLASYHRVLLLSRSFLASLARVCNTAFQQLRIAAVKYNGQDNDSVIYPRFGPPSARLFPTTVEVVVAFPRAFARVFRHPFNPRSGPVYVCAAFKLMISNITPPRIPHHGRPWLSREIWVG